LASNLHIIEPSLKLYTDEGITGVEFPVGGRYIDILAVDSAGGYVVIELKVSKGYDRVVGQLLRYVGWIKKNHAESGQRVRGIIIAKQISEDLRLACSELPSVSLYEYALSVTVKQVASERECRPTLQSRGHAPASQVTPLISNIGERVNHERRRVSRQ
jgi:hypothetical protein